MDFLLSIMCFILYILSRLFIWHEVGENENTKIDHVFSPLVKFDIRCYPNVGKHV